MEFKFDHILVMHRVALDDLGVESGDRGVDRDGGLDLNTQVVYMIEIPEE